MEVFNCTKNSDTFELKSDKTAFHTLFFIPHTMWVVLSNVRDARWYHKFCSMYEN